MYELNVGRTIGKTTSLNESELEDFVKLAKTQKSSNNSWAVSIDEINKETLDLGIKNPKIEETTDKRTPTEIISEIEDLQNQTNEMLKKIKELL